MAAWVNSFRRQLIYWGESFQSKLIGGIMFELLKDLPKEVLLSGTRQGDYRSLFCGFGVIYVP